MTPTWILILSMAGTQGLALDHIRFDTREACVKAGELWMVETFPNIDKYSFRLVTPNYICVSSQ